MAALTEAALVASNLGVVSGLGAITREVTELRAVVACDVCGRTRFGALARDVSFSLAVVASDDRLLSAVGLIVTVQKCQSTIDTFERLACLPNLAAVEAGSGHLFGVRAFLRHVTGLEKC